jgi:pyridoxal phosphate enzyme (YggS family)
VVTLCNSVTVLVFYYTERHREHTENHRDEILSYSEMPDISKNIKYLKSLIPAHVKLIAVSKTRTVSEILEAYNAGQRCFGENRVQEILTKKDLLPADIEWHLIGHLQSNKVKFIVPFIGMIESVDSIKLLRIIDNEAVNAGVVVNCLLQVHIASEETKFGFNPDEVIEAASAGAFNGMTGIRIAGVMGMATFTDDLAQVAKEFALLSDCFRILKSDHFKEHSCFKEISMGMSGDYLTAIQKGSTIVRIGSMIFGERNK